jgi:hypothetical protein
MLVSFSVSNFRSFDGEQTFSMVASNRLAGSHEGHTVAIPDSDSRVLRAGVIYGANGAKTVATGTRKKDAPIRRDVFRFGNGASEPTTFDLQFIIASRLYRYGIKFDDTRVIEEWLARIVDGKERTVYERMTGSDGGVRVQLGKASGKTAKLDALARIGGLRNQSFLATIRATLDDDVPRDVHAAYVWLTLLLNLISPQNSQRNVARDLIEDPTLFGFAGEFLKATSTGVDHLAVLNSELTSEDFASLVPEDVMPDELSDNESWAHALPNGDVLRAARGPSGLQFSRIKIQAAHINGSGKGAALDMQDESDGTRRLLQLMPALHTLNNAPAVFFIDEVDRSLHPMLARAFLEYYLNSCQSENRQLIMTTHESSLLDQDLLRRDEIWFDEKDDAGATSLYSLLDFKIRNDLDIRKNYLQGRFGAIPFLGGIERLMNREGKTE